MNLIGHHTEHVGAVSIGSMDPGKGIVKACSPCGNAPKMTLDYYRKSGVSNLLTNRKLREIIQDSFKRIDELEAKLAEKWGKE